MENFDLLPLNCTSCASALAAESTDTIFYCISCRSGYSIDSKGQGLQPLEVKFVASVTKAAELYLPFWLLPTRVTLHERHSNRSGGRSGLSGLMKLFAGNEQDSAAGEKSFTIPAFQGPLQSIINLATVYTERFPDLDQLLGEQLIGGAYDVEDAKKLAHCILVGNEINRSDTLIKLRYELDFGAPRLLGVPFVHYEGGLVDALFGVEIELPPFLRPMRPSHLLASSRS